ncbi:hypothetical protein HYV82_04120 [Candidatus Woesearchaeota archaeon]|nr:hypothetical protein [Candidatus Woesearchaeota archaeon]
MGMEKVREEVLAKAKRQAAQIVAEANRESDAIMKSAEEKADENRKKALQEAERQMAEARTRETAAAELEAAKMMLDAKKKIIEEVFEEAKSRVAKTPAPERRRHIKTLIEKAKQQIDIDRVLCAEKDINSVEGYKSQPTAITGGIIIENKEGTVRVDCSYEALMEKAKEKALKDVANTLFKSQ